LRTVGPRTFYRREDDTESYYWIVTVAVPVSQAPDVVVDAVTVGEPVARRVASPGVVVENVSTVVSLEVQVELFVTLLPPLSVAVNCALVVVKRVNGLEGFEVMVSVPEVPPVVLPVIVPCTPANVAVIVTLELGPIAVTRPVVLTVAHEVELDQLTELVTILVPLL